MIKKLSILALAGCFAMPTMASAASNADLASKIDQLTKELSQLKDQMEEQAATFEDIDEKAEGWDIASRIQLSGDIRSRLDYHTAETADAYLMSDVVAGALTLAGATPDIIGTSAGTTALMNYYGSGGAATQSTRNSEDWDNDTMLTTRMRMNMRVKATENVEIKARVVGYKTWGMQSNPASPGGFSTPYYQNDMVFDGNAARQPIDSALRMDRAFMNWNNIGGQPVWFSIGRRPTSDGPPAHLRMGVDKRMATPTAYMDYPFDGISLGYAYANLFGMDDIPGRIRFCYGRGFESGLESDSSSAINDTDFAGLSWDVMKKGNRFITVQSFVAMNIFNYPGDVNMANPAMANFIDMQWQSAGAPAASQYQLDEWATLNRQAMGDIFHTTGVYMDKVADLNYFLSAGWSLTDPSGDVDEWGQALGGDKDNKKHGYSVYAGVRYDLNDLGLKFGAEYNWGSENWIAFTPGNDDIYASKLMVRGSAYELYMIYDLPSGEAVSKFGKAFMRLGWQHYEYDQTGSGNWMSNPVEIDDATLQANMQGVAPLESYDTVYLTMEAYF